MIRLAARTFAHTVKRLRRPAAPPPVSGDGLPPDHDPLAGSEMSFIDHLEDLRWHLIKGLGGMALVTIVCCFFTGWIVDHVLLAPKQPDFITYRLFGIELAPFALQNRSVSGQFFAFIGTVFAAGMVLGAPILIYQLWKFIEPGLYPHERKGLRFAAFGATFFFMLGIAFGYFVVTPLSLQFFAGFQLSPDITNEFDITKYFSMVTMWSLGVGLVFELPVVIYFLARVGILTATQLRKVRKYVFIIVLVVAAVVTPPDPFSQIAVAIPLMGLYEMAVWLAGRIEKTRAREEARERAREAQEAAAAGGAA